MGCPGFEFQQSQEFFSLFQNAQAGSGAHRTSYSIDTEIISLEQSVTSTAHFHLVRMLRMSGVVPLLTLYDFMA